MRGCAASLAADSTVIVAPPAVADGLGERERAQTEVLANGESLERGALAVEALPMHDVTEERSQFHEEDTRHSPAGGVRSRRAPRRRPAVLRS
jgi:hypothetical protein